MLKSRLRDFKLSEIYNSLDERLKYAGQKSLSYEEFLEILLEDEENNRRDNSHKKRYAKAKFPYLKTIEDFDFSYQPSIDRRVINDLSTCQFIEQKKNVVLIGNPGTSKTHISIDIGIKALTKGYKVLFTQVSDILQALYFSKAESSFYGKLNYYLSFNLLILDDLGFKNSHHILQMIFSK